MTARTVLITGCSTGIGRAAALRFAAEGHHVVATARRLDAIRELESPNLRVTVCDVTDEASMAAAVEFARRAFGPVEVLVNNAGYGEMGFIETVPIAEARRQFEVNVFGAARLIQLVLPGMRSAGWGRIINVSSIAGRMTIPLGGWYAASKFALEALADTLRLEVEVFGIHTVSILPGPVRTGFIGNLSIADVPDDAPEFYRRLVERLRRYHVHRKFEISAENVARVIVRAAEVRRPRPRYVLTLPAWLGWRFRPFFTDRAWDRVLRTFYDIPSSRTRADGAPRRD